MTPDALSVSVPNDPTLSSTWTGDVLINSNDNFGPGGLNVTSVLMHEAGHVFGIGESTDPNSPMYAQYTGAVSLTAQDIASLQALYGVRAPDRYEGSSGNNTIDKATQIQTPGGYTGATPLVAYGDVTTNSDVDFYAIKPPSNYSGPITFRLQSAGISLLTPHLTVLDAKGNVVGDAQSTCDLGDTLTVHLDQSTPGATYYLEVRGATQDVFGIGSYAVAATFDSANTVSAANLDTVMRGPYQSLNPNDLATFLADPSHVLFNNGRNDSSTIQLVSTAGYAPNTRYQTVGSIASTNDVDMYRISTPNAPSNQGLVLTVTVRALSPNGTAARVTVLDNNMNPANAQILANSDGSFTVQATGLKSGGNIFLKVTPNQSLENVTGNYALDAEFGNAAATLSSLAGGGLSASTPTQGYNFYVGESQLMQFVFSTSSAPAGTAVQMTITNASGNVVYSLTAMAGDTVSGPALFLTPGAYALHFTVLNTNGGIVPPVTYNLLGDGFSDPIGPVPDDPTLTAVYTNPTTPVTFTYPNGTTTPSPYVVVPIPQ
jgi:hypothetical protein